MCVCVCVYVYFVFFLQLKGGLGTDVFVGIALGAVAFLAFIFCMKIVVFHKRKRQGKHLCSVKPVGVTRMSW